MEFIICKYKDGAYAVKEINGNLVEYYTTGVKGKKIKSGRGLSENDFNLLCQVNGNKKRIVSPSLLEALRNYDPSSILNTFEIVEVSESTILIADGEEVYNASNCGKKVIPSNFSVFQQQKKKAESLFKIKGINVFDALKTYNESKLEEYKHINHGKLSTRN